MNSFISFLKQNSAVNISQILLEMLKEVVYFPLWWYSVGLVNFTRKLIKFLINRQKALALMIWIKNIHRPMYGQTDWQGVLISIFMRIVQIIFRSIMMLVYLILALAALAIWLFLPLLTLFEIIFQLSL